MEVTQTSTSTPEPKEDFEQLRSDVVTNFGGFMVDYTDTESINVFKFENGILEIEVKHEYAGENRLPDLAFEITKLIADSYAIPQVDINHIKNLFDGDELGFKLTVLDARSAYEFRSFTDYETLQLIAARKLSFSEWQRLCAVN